MSNNIKYLVITALLTASCAAPSNTKVSIESNEYPEGNVDGPNETCYTITEGAPYYCETNNTVKRR